MTKSEVVNEINKKTGVDKADALKCVEAFMEVVKESLIKHMGCSVAPHAIFSCATCDLSVAPHGIFSCATCDL